MANESRRRGMHPALAFFLGFLFGIIVLIGAVAGAVIFALNYKIDKISANKDADGNYLYINADPDNGGVKNALELVKRVQEISKSPSSLTLGQVEDLLPVTNKLTDAIVKMSGEYIQLNVDELKQVAFSELGEYLQDAILDLRLAVLLDELNVNLGDNFIVQSILYDEEGVPVTLRAFVEGDALQRLYDKKVIDLVGTEDIVSTKLLGDITIGNLMNGNVDFESIINSLAVTDFVDIDPDNRLMVYFGYGITKLKVRGGEYTGMYELSDETLVPCRLEVAPAEGGGLKVTEAYYLDGDGNRVIIGGTTVPEVDKRVENLMDELTLPDIIAVNPPSANNKNTIMIFLAYSVSDITEEAGAGWVGTYHFADGREEKCYIISEDKEITDVCIYENGELVSVESTTVSKVALQVNRLPNTLKIKDVINISPTDRLMTKLGEYKINDVDNAANDLTLADFIDVTVGGEDKTSETVLSYVVYGLTDIKSNSGTAAGESYTHTGVYHAVSGEEERCYIVCSEGKITKVFLDKEGTPEEVSGTKINDVTGRVNGITKDLTIGELMDVGESNMIMKAISGSTIESLPRDIENLAVNELYAESIYSANSQVKDEQVLLYQAVNADEMRRITQYITDEIYYTYTDNEYTLANTTGKLKQSEFDDLISKGTELWYAGEGKILFNSAYLYYIYNAENGKYTMVSAGTDIAGVLSVLPANTEYYTYGAANAMWKILLYSNGSEKAFSVNGLTNMITNVSENVQNSKMRELEDAGMVHLGTNLEKRVTWTSGGTQYSKLLGDMTLNELLDAIIAISDMLESLPSVPSVS